MLRADLVLQGTLVAAVDGAIAVVIEQPLVRSDDEVLGVVAIQSDHNGRCNGRRVNRFKIWRPNCAEREVQHGAVERGAVNGHSDGLRVLLAIRRVDCRVETGVNLVERRGQLALTVTGGAVGGVQVH